MTSVKTLKVGFTEAHGMLHEASLTPPDGVQYEFLKPLTKHHGLFRSPIKGFMREYDDRDVDLVEGVISPVVTKRPWVYSIACFQEPMAFSLLGCPVPKRIRRFMLERYFLNQNCKQLVFWSQAGLDTLRTYGGFKDNHEIFDRSTVVYPAIRKVEEHLRHHESGELQIMFSGDFFLKGGVHVVDAFLELQHDFPEATLRLCCDPKTDFKTTNQELKNQYLKKIEENKKIVLGRVSREVMLKEILPQTDIYLLPTYSEAFGFAILEAMAYGIPVIATNLFAIPEMIEHEVSGFLINTNRFDMTKMFRGCKVKDVPDGFRNYMTETLTNLLRPLLDSKALRKQIGHAARANAQTKFSFESRNAKMSQVYFDAIG